MVNNKVDTILRAESWDFFAMQLRQIFEEARQLYVKRFPDLAAPSFREVCPYLACPSCSFQDDDEDAQGA